MNASFPPNSSRQTAAPQGASQGGRQTPSVPISVYRELATELKATQAMVDSLTQQNHQLSQQNHMLRQEMLSFAEAADRLRQAVEYSQPQAVTAATMPAQYTQAVQGIGAEPVGFGDNSVDDTDDGASPLSERISESMGAGVSNLAGHLNRLVSPKPKKEASVSKSGGRLAGPKGQPANGPQLLHTEERLEPSRSSQMSSGTSDLSGLWLATTILLIVVSAFGAGFLIMKPLLNNSR